MLSHQTITTEFKKITALLVENTKDSKESSRILTLSLYNRAKESNIIDHLGVLQEIIAIYTNTGLDLKSAYYLSKAREWAKEFDKY